jgi:lysophospholipase L1-like esterase
MLECLIVGDGIAATLAEMRPECKTFSKEGLSSQKWNKEFLKKTPLMAKRVIISLGSHDHFYVFTEPELRVLRKLTEADKVYWILPAGNEPKFQFDVSRTQNIIRRIAADYDDVVLPISRVEEDGINPNPNGYKILAERIKK